MICARTVADPAQKEEEPSWFSRPVRAENVEKPGARSSGASLRMGCSLSVLTVSRGGVTNAGRWGRCEWACGLGVGRTKGAFTCDSSESPLPSVCAFLPARSMVHVRHIESVCREPPPFPHPHHRFPGTATPTASPSASTTATGCPLYKESPPLPYLPTE